MNYFVLMPPWFWRPLCDHPFLPARKYTVADPSKGVGAPTWRDAEGRLLRHNGRILKCRLKGVVIQDIYWTENGYDEILITDELKGLIEANAFTGLEIREAELEPHGLANKGVSRLWQLVTTHIARSKPDSPAWLQEDAPSELRSATSPYGVHLVEGQVLPDFFGLDDAGGWTCVSARVAKLLLEQHAKEFVLLRLSRVRRPESLHGYAPIRNQIEDLCWLGMSPDSALEYVRMAADRIQGCLRYEDPTWSMFEEFLAPLRERFFSQQIVGLEHVRVVERHAKGE